MGINYNKYINSTGIHYISNSGGDEKGGITGGKAGDQTGREWQLKAWYNRPWTHVFRHPDPRVRRLIAELAIEAALNDNIGYDQNQRGTFWAQLKAVGYRPANIKTKCEADCSAGANSIVKAVGYLLGMDKLKNVSSANSSRNTRSGLKAAGFSVLTDTKYRSSGKYLLPGDILLYENHHVATNITRGAKATGAVADHVDSVNGSNFSSGSTGPRVTIANCKECNIRTGPGTSYKSVGTAKCGESFAAPDATGWVPIVYNGAVRWVSAKYAGEVNAQG